MESRPVQWVGERSLKPGWGHEQLSSATTKPQTQRSNWGLAKNQGQIKHKTKNYQGQLDNSLNNQIHDTIKEGMDNLHNQGWTHKRTTQTQNHMHRGQIDNALNN